MEMSFRADLNVEHLTSKISNSHSLDRLPTSANPHMIKSPVRFEWVSTLLTIWHPEDFTNILPNTRSGFGRYSGSSSLSNHNRIFERGQSVDWRKSSETEDHSSGDQKTQHTVTSIEMRSTWVEKSRDGRNSHSTGMYCTQRDLMACDHELKDDHEGWLSRLCWWLGFSSSSFVTPSWFTSARLGEGVNWEIIWMNLSISH